MNDFTRGYMRGYKDAQKEALNREAMDSSPNGEAQPEQEPVANYCRECLTYNGHQEGCSQYVATQNEKQKPAAWRLYKDGELYALKHEKEDRGLYYTWEPLYTTPPQPQNEVRGNVSRKPLTEQFVMDSTRELSTDVRWPSTFIDVWRLCEAAHGITSKE